MKKLMYLLYMLKVGIEEQNDDLTKIYRITSKSEEHLNKISAHSKKILEIT